MSGKPSTNFPSRRAIALRAVGTTVGQRWTLLGVIGSGGTATVYEAVHRNGSRVALKMLHADFISHSAIRRRLFAEGYAANLVKHEGAVKVLDDGDTDDGGAYLVMELLHGETLAARLARNGPLPWDQVLEWGIALLEILAAAHEQRVVHRDVKPSNIFITDRGQVKLLDFGIARILDDLAEGDFLTQQGIALGTPAFMAPEQALGNREEIGAPTDVWGVGATLFQLLTGRPVQDPKSNATASAARVVAASPVRAFAPRLPAEIARVIDRALSLRVSDRWPSARAMIRALELAREAPLNPPTSGAETLTEERIIVPKATLNARQYVAFAALGIVLASAGGLYRMATKASAPKLQAFASPPAASRAAESARVAPATMAPAALSATSLVESTIEARFANATKINAPRRAPAGPVRRKPSEAPLQPTTKQAPAVPRVASDLDSMLDRRK